MPTTTTPTDGFSGDDYWPEEMAPQTFYTPGRARLRGEDRGTAGVVGEEARGAGRMTGLAAVRTQAASRCRSDSRHGPFHRMRRSARRLRAPGNRARHAATALSSNASQSVSVAIAASISASVSRRNRARSDRPLPASSKVILVILPLMSSCSPCADDLPRFVSFRVYHRDDRLVTLHHSQSEVSQLAFNGSQLRRIDHR